MTRTIAAFLAAALVAGLVPDGSAEARSAKAKAKRGEKVVAMKRVARTGPRFDSNGYYEPIPGQPGLRDRTTVLLPNGRLNGQEFFDRMGDLAGDVGN